MGYSDELLVGQVYSYTKDQILDLIKRSFVFTEEEAFWAEYSYTANIRWRPMLQQG